MPPRSMFGITIETSSPHDRERRDDVQLRFGDFQNASPAALPDVVDRGGFSAELRIFPGIRRSNCRTSPRSLNLGAIDVA